MNNASPASLTRKSIKSFVAQWGHIRSKASKIFTRRLQENNVSCLLASPLLNAIKSIPIETVSFFDSLILKSTARVNQ